MGESERGTGIGESGLVEEGFEGFGRGRGEGEKEREKGVLGCGLAVVGDTSSELTF